MGIDRLLIAIYYIYIAKISNVLCLYKPLMEISCEILNRKSSSLQDLLLKFRL